MPVHPPLICKGDLLLFQCLTEILNFLSLRLSWRRPQLKEDSHLDKWTVLGECLWVFVCGRPLSVLLVCLWRLEEGAALPRMPPQTTPWSPEGFLLNPVWSLTPLDGSHWTMTTTTTPHPGQEPSGCCSQVWVIPLDGMSLLSPWPLQTSQKGSRGEARDSF